MMAAVRKKRWTALFAAVAAAAFVAAMACAGAFGAAAEGSPLTMREGASVRLAENSGIRFTADIDAEFYAQKVSDGAYTDANGYFGMILVPQAYVEACEAAGESDYRSYFEAHGGMAEMTYAPSGIYAENGAYALRLSLVDFYMRNVELEFAAIAYYYDGAAYTYSAPSAPRSALEVAFGALVDTESEYDEEQLAALKDYALLAVAAHYGAEQAEDRTFTFRGESMEKDELLAAVESESAFLRSDSGKTLKLSDQQIEWIKTTAAAQNKNAVEVYTYGVTDSGDDYSLTGTDVLGNAFTRTGVCGAWTKTTVLVDDLVDLAAGGKDGDLTAICGRIGAYVDYTPAIELDGEEPLPTLALDDKQQGTLSIPAAFVNLPEGEPVAAAYRVTRYGEEETLASGTASAAGSYSVTANGIYELTYTVACGGETLEKTFVIDAYGADTATSGTLSWNEITLKSVVLENGLTTSGYDGPAPTATETTYDDVHGVQVVASKEKSSSPVFRIASDREFKITQSSVVTFKVRGGENFKGQGIFISYEGANGGPDTGTLSAGTFLSIAADGAEKAKIAADNNNNGNLLPRNRTVYTGVSLSGLLLNLSTPSTGWTTITLTFEGVENPTLEGLVISFADVRWNTTTGADAMIYISDFTIEEGAN